MTNLKSLYDVLPAELKITNKAKMSDLPGKTIVINSATFTTAGGVEYAAINFVFEGDATPQTVTANQEQITKVVRYLAENNHLPIRAMVIASGKSYAITNPPEATA